MVRYSLHRSEPLQHVQFRYDPLGRRTQKQVWLQSQDLRQTTGKRQTTTFLWEGFRLLQETRDGMPLTYVYADQGSYEPLARIDGGPQAQVFYFHTAPNGEPESLTDRDGTLCWQGHSSAWGKTKYEENQQHLDYSQNLRLQGQYLDRETGLHYNLFRYYDPDIGRFTQHDPIGLAGGINLYQYAPNPLGWVDPWGWKPRCAPTKDNDHNQAAFGRQWQGRGIYKGRDSWSNTMLKEGDIVYGGAPGQSGFYFDKATLNAAGGSRQKLWESLQVLPHRDFGYRGQIQAYRVKRDAIAGTGQALSQDPSIFGQGGGTQFFLSNYKTILEPIGSPFKLGM